MNGSVRAYLRQLRRGILAGLKAGGAFSRVARSQWRTRRLLILCYHGVSLIDEHEQDPGFYMRPSLLAARLAMLKGSGYTVLPLCEGLERLRAGSLPPRSVCLTFDDGMNNFAVAALPLLERFGCPVTMYMSTYYCIHDEPVFDSLCSYLLHKARGRVVDTRARLGVDDVWDLRTFNGVIRAFWSVQRAVEQQALDRAEKTAFARRIAELLSVPFEVLIAKRLFHLLRPDDVRRLAQRGVDFQLHTHRHRSPLDRDLYLREMRDNRTHLEALVGYAPTHLSYPSGVWRSEFLPWLREAEIASATTAEPGLAEPDDNPLLLPRVMDSEHLTAIEFEGWLTGLMSWLVRRNGSQRVVGNRSDRRSRVSGPEAAPRGVERRVQA